MTDITEKDMSKDPRVVKLAKEHNAKILAANFKKNGTITVQLDNGLSYTIRPEETLVRQQHRSDPPTEGVTTADMDDEEAKTSKKKGK